MQYASVANNKNFDQICLSTRRQCWLTSWNNYTTIQFRWKKNLQNVSDWEDAITQSIFRVFSVFSNNLSSNFVVASAFLSTLVIFWVNSEECLFKKNQPIR